ncbi:hypothetical protein CY35_08G137300 [Sphagnum magellanicum]|nr:hypothetical protein CY35_08G137300 [Sphagnum magellanicum]KAH9555835.1 hypothetical protein CY35_08G137300 [Sphagnum magellanicum]KAH9555836.1 hypothetical protein CY35_08G137300 [Sphagnum magellanicum]
MGQSVGEPARVLLLFSSLLFLGTVGRVNTIGAGRASENHNHRVLEFLDVVKGHAEFRVSDKPVQGHFLGVADQQLRNEYPWVSRRLLQSNEILETSEEHKELWRPRLDLNLDQILEHSSHNTQQYLTDDSEGAGILGTLSEAGLIYVKEVLVNQILKEITPLSLPDIHSQAKSPIGQVDTTITHIELSGANVSYSDVDLGKTGITVFAGDIKARMRFHWKYECTSSYIPFPVTDGGWADVEVTGMQAGVTFTLQAHNGTLRLTVVECGTYIEDLDIELHGGASWLYQWFVYAFDDEIRAAVEGAITSAIISGARKLDTFLLGLPRSLPIDDISAVDVTVVEDPFVSPTFLSVGVKGEFISLKKPTVPLQPDHSLPPGIFCSESAKMITIAVCDYVINSAAKVYFEAGVLDWLVDELPQESMLNTAFWKWLIPQLYKKYPNDDMALDFSVSSAPQVELSKDGAKAFAGADMTIIVKTNNGSVPVACLSMTFSMDAIAGLEGNNITAQVTLNDLTLQLKWSEIGKFPVKLMQSTVRTLISKVIIPILNHSLKKGFPLPVFPAIDLQNADVRYDNGYILICSDVHYKGGYIKPSVRPPDELSLTVFLENDFLSGR